MSRHEWVNSTLGHGANMCRHCLMTDDEAAALGRLETCDAERTPTDAEIEAMAEKLWDVFRHEAGDPSFVHLSWQDVLAEGREGVLPTAFRAMARVALEGTPNGDEVRG